MWIILGAIFCFGLHNAYLNTCNVIEENIINQLSHAIPPCRAASAASVWS
jgi:hypothetical protein